MTISIRQGNEVAQQHSRLRSNQLLFKFRHLTPGNASIAVMIGGVDGHCLQRSPWFLWLLSRGHETTRRGSGQLENWVHSVFGVKWVLLAGLDVV